MDNGFVTFLPVPVDFQPSPIRVPGPPACTPQISILSLRGWITGALRCAKDRTLILTGRDLRL